MMLLHAESIEVIIPLKAVGVQSHDGVSNPVNRKTALMACTRCILSSPLCFKRSRDCHVPIVAVECAIQCQLKILFLFCWLKRLYFVDLKHIRP